jgi:hypothetical protein
MKKLTIILALLVSISAFGQQNAINRLGPEEKNEGWELLFNGENLDGWRTFQGGEITGWKVIDGVLNNSGVGTDHGGDIITNKEYTDFELYMEWKIARESNSGVFFHVDEDNVKAIYESGPEYQLIDDKGWPSKIGPLHSSGANYAMHPPKNAKVKPIDEWNATRIVVKGTHVKHYLNGDLVVEYDLWDDEWKKLKSEGKWKDFPHYGMSKTGHIGLQDHGGLTQFRNIKIKTL